VTLAPLINPTVRGVEGKPVLIEPGQKCAAPGCLSLAQQRHHMWPRSFLRGQPYEWVTVMSRTIPNSCGLCLRHHAWITGETGGGHRAKITYDERLEILLWWERRDDDSWRKLGPLRGQTFLEVEPEAARPRRAEGLCPTCGHIERPKTPRGPKRKVKAWTLSVPDDSEQGAEVLDTYVEDLAVLMGLDPTSPRLLRYHVLVPALEWVAQHRVEFIRDWEEAAA
jgi:hypothetical protein